MYQLSRLLHDYHRDLHCHLEQQDIAPSLYAPPWFLTSFASQYPLGFVARVFGEFGTMRPPGWVCVRACVRACVYLRVPACVRASQKCDLLMFHSMSGSRTPLPSLNLLYDLIQSCLTLTPPRCIQSTHLNTPTPPLHIHSGLNVCLLYLFY